MKFSQRVVTDISGYSGARCTRECFAKLIKGEEVEVIPWDDMEIFFEASFVDNDGMKIYTTGTKQQIEQLISR